MTPERLREIESRVRIFNADGTHTTTSALLYCEDVEVLLQRIKYLEWSLSFTQLERDNRTSAYEVGVKQIGELRRAKEAAEAKLDDLRRAFDSAQSELKWLKNSASDKVDQARIVGYEDCLREFAQSLAQIDGPKNVVQELDINAF